MYNSLRDLLFNAPAMASLSANGVLMSLGTALICGLLIYAVYRFFNNSVVYSANFNLLIVMVCLVTAFIIITIGANLVLSLGMVGALSIVRFRAAVKDPLDVGFLFWAVAAGLTAGAQLYVVSVLATACISLAFIAFSLLRMEKRCFLFIIRYAPDKDAQIAEMLKPLKYKLKNKTHTADWVELTIEVKIKKNDTSSADPIVKSPDVINATLVEYTGDYT